MEKKGVVNLGSTLIGVVVTIVFGVLSFPRDGNPSLDFIIETNVSAVNVKEDLRKLTILYDGEDILKMGKTISILTVKVINNSNVNIAASSYDNDIPFGFKVNQGEVLETPVIIESNDDYLKKGLNFSVDSLNQIIFPKLLIDGGRYFTIKLLLLKSKFIPVLSGPLIAPLGKISGIAEMPVRDMVKELEESRMSFWSRVDMGAFLVFLIALFFTCISIVVFVINRNNSKKMGILISDLGKESERCVNEINCLKLRKGVFGEEVQEDKTEEKSNRRGRKFAVKKNPDITYVGKAAGRSKKTTNLRVIKMSTSVANKQNITFSAPKIIASIKARELADKVISARIKQRIRPLCPKTKGSANTAVDKDKKD